MSSAQTQVRYHRVAIQQRQATASPQEWGPAVPSASPPSSPARSSETKKKPNRYQQLLGRIAPPKPKTATPERPESRNVSERSIGRLNGARAAPRSAPPAPATFVAPPRVPAAPAHRAAGPPARYTVRPCDSAEEEDIPLAHFLPLAQYRIYVQNHIAKVHNIPDDAPIRRGRVDRFARVHRAPSIRSQSAEILTTDAASDSGAQQDLDDNIGHRDIYDKWLKEIDAAFNLASAPAAASSSITAVASVKLPDIRRRKSTARYENQRRTTGGHRLPATLTPRKSFKRCEATRRWTAGPRLFDDFARLETVDSHHNSQRSSKSVNPFDSAVDLEVKIQDQEWFGALMAKFDQSLSL